MVDHEKLDIEHGKPVWLDCDPGHDDAMALMLAGWSPALTLLGVSTVASNQVVEKTTRNALDVLDLCGLDHIGEYVVMTISQACITSTWAAVAGMLLSANGCHQPEQLGCISLGCKRTTHSIRMFLWALLVP